MSIQDESFPHDEFFSESEYSFNNGPRYQFPNVRRQQQQHNQKQLHLQLNRQEERDDPEQFQLQQHQQQSDEKRHQLTCSNVLSATSAAASAESITPEGNISTSSSTSNEENLSLESANGRPSSVLSGKTTVSEPTDFGGEAKKSSTTVDEQMLLGKANSCQNVHSKYTKRRYRHVQSKVGQYIAQMKAEDEKRRNSMIFQRHSSLPETLSDGATHQQQQQKCVNNNNNNTENRNGKRSSSMELHMHKMDETISDAEANLSEILSNTPATTTTGSSSSSSMQRHECSDDVVQTDFIDKLTYAQLVNEKEQIQSHSDYLQSRLDEKMCENMRLKRNVDFLRIELSNCQDKLKRQSTYQKQSGTSGSNMRAISLSSSSSSVNALGRQMFTQSKSTKATQTELLPPSLPSAMATPMKLSVLMAHDVFSTPENAITDVYSRAFESLTTENDDGTNIIKIGNSVTTTGAGAVKFNKSIATIQPIPLNISSMADQSGHDNSRPNVLRQRLNSSQKQTQQQQHQQQSLPVVANEQISGSSDSAIDIELTELPLSKHQRKRNNVDAAAEIDVSEFVYFNAHTDRYATSPAIVLSTLHCNDRQINYSMNSSTSASTIDTTASSCDNRYSARGNKKHKSARSRWLRFFAPCTRCKDLNQSTLMDGGAVPLEQSQTQIPLLEKSGE